MRITPACALLCLAVSVSGCATLPHDAAERALYVDLRKAVQLSEDSGWVVDRAQIKANAETAMRSACQVERAKLDDLEAWLDGRIALAGGPAEQLYREHGHDLSAATEALTLERTRALLRYARSRIADDCPFWLEPNAKFRGTQGDAGRFVLLAETHGFASYVFDTKVPAFGGGGRIFVGHGVGPRLTLALGGEVAASGAIVSNAHGRGLDTTFTVAMPLLLRLTRFARIFDLELAPVVRFNPGQNSLPPGARLEVGAGISGMRGASFMPYGMLYVGYEYHPKTSTTPDDHTLQIGTRFAVDWAP
jgi:hypothetical protein